MSIALCTRDDVADWLSEEGLQSREDDDRSGVGGMTVETDRSDRFILRASARVASYLSQRYEQVDYAGSSPPTNTPEIVKHWTAVVAAYYLCIRRGLPVSAELAAEYQQAFVDLAAVVAGDRGIPEAPDEPESSMTVSNYHVDGNYRNNKIRVTSGSTGKRPTNPNIKNNQENPGGFGIFD